MKEKLSAISKRMLALRGRRLAMSLFVLLFVVYAFIVFSIAWYSQALSVKARGSHFGIVGMSSGEFQIYEWVGESKTVGSWVSVNGINFTDGVPNENRRYMIFSVIPFSGVNISFTTIAGGTATDSLFDYVYMREVDRSLTAATLDPDDNSITYAFVGETPDYFTYADKAGTDSVSTGDVQLSGGNASAVVFDIYMSKDVCNIFEMWGFRGSVELS